MLVSILINSYNNGRFLRECIESALNQKYPEIQVVVVDDGSTDESREIIQSFGNRIVTVLKENGGQGSAYNAGFAVSQGDGLCFLDSDDCFYPDTVDRAVARYQTDPAAAKVQWPLEITDFTGKPIGRLSTKYRPPEGDLKEMVIREGPFYDEDLTTGAFYPRWFVERVFPVPDSHYRNGADVYLTTLAPIFGPILNLDEPLGIYRHHDHNHYKGRELDDDRVRNYIARFEANAEALEKYLGRLNLPSEPRKWRETNFNYVWPQRLLCARQEIERSVPEGGVYILVDEAEWGSGEQVRNRHSLHLMERDGQYWGSPPDEQTAINELERLRDQKDAGFVFFWWTAFWWFQEYPALLAHLRRRYRVVVDKDYLLGFDLNNYRGTHDDG